MAFPFNAEGEVIVDIDTPAKAAEVRAGIEHWLANAGARGLRWDAGNLCFNGVSEWSPQYRFSLIRGLERGEIRVREETNRVVIQYTLVRSAFHLWAMLLIGIPLAFAVVAPSLALGFCVLPAILAVNYAGLAVLALDFRSGLRRASIRGQADGAVAELAELRRRSEEFRTRAAV
jgi:hypothetical protein